MAATFYIKKSRTCQVATLELAQWLIDDLAGETGPGWTIVDTYSSGAATQHETPSGDGSAVSQLSADNAWRAGGLALGDYIVLESNSTSGEFQLLIEYQANDELHFILSFDATWQTGANNSNPTAGANWSGTVSNLVDLDTNNGGGSGNFTFKADDDYLYVLYEDGNATRMNMLFVGKPLGTLANDETSAIIYTTPETVAINSTSGLASASAFEKLSNVDDSTRVNVAASSLEYATGNIIDTSNVTKDTQSSQHRAYALHLFATTAGHISPVGYLPGLYCTNENIIGTGVETDDGNDYLIFGDVASGGKLVLAWDGSTAY